MTRLVAAAVVALLCILAQPATHSSAKPPCGHRHGFEGCSRPGAITIGGGDSNKPASDPGDHGGGTQGADAPGTIRLVACGSNTEATLAAMGDAFAGQDARTCTPNVDMCSTQAQITGVPHQQYVRMVKQHGGSWSTTGSECDPVTNAPPKITPLMVWQQARRLIPTAAIGLAPRHDTLANMETIMWLATAAERDLPTATILGRPVHVHISIDHVTWDFGDGHSATSNNPGTPYDAKHNPCHTRDCPAYYGHTYTTTGHLTVTATITWTANFRVADGPVTTIPGTLDGPSSTATLLVQEARSVLVPDPTPN